MATIVYLDGFNLYYGAFKGTPHKWLDIDALSRRLLPNDQIVAIRYFTALVAARPDDPRQPQRQQAYLRALRTIPGVAVHLGHYLTHTVRMPLCQPAADRASDRGGHPDRGEGLRREPRDLPAPRCLPGPLRHGGGHLQRLRPPEPIRVVEQELGVKVGIINPHPAARRSRALRSSFFKQLRSSILSSCQLPAVLKDNRGEIHKPGSW